MSSNAVKTLNNLARFMKSVEGGPDGVSELLAYIGDNKGDISEAFGKTVAETVEALQKIEGEPSEKVFSIIRATVEGAKKKAQNSKASAKEAEFQEAAELAAKLATKHNGEVYLDPELLFEATPTKGDIGFCVNDATFAIAASKLRAVAKLKKDDLACKVDPAGVHFTWGQKGRLTLKGAPYKADRVFSNVVVA